LGGNAFATDSETPYKIDNPIGSTQFSQEIIIHTSYRTTVMKFFATVILAAVTAVVTNAQDGAGKPNKNTDLRILQEVEATSVLSFSLSLPAAAGIEGPVVDVAVQSGKSGKTESPTIYPTDFPTFNPTVTQCTKPGGKSGKAGNGELYCLGEDCGKCAALEGNFIATCPVFTGTQDPCVAGDVAKDFLFCDAICTLADFLLCDILSVPAIADYCLG
jgi:hypothetical protein